MNESIRPATRDDLAAIAAIQAASPEASQWEPASYLEHDCTVAIVDGAVAGFLVSREIAGVHVSHPSGRGEREILNLAVHPSQRRRGVARRLLENELAGARGQWFLEVRESNAGARRFYEALGFRVSGQRKDYYREPPEGAIVMRFFS